jgi:hypothetical protein
MKAVTAAVGGRQAELWGDEQWMRSQVIEERCRGHRHRPLDDVCVQRRSVEASWEA